MQSTNSQKTINRRHLCVKACCDVATKHVKRGCHDVASVRDLGKLHMDQVLFNSLCESIGLNLEEERDVFFIPNPIDGIVSQQNNPVRKMY